MKIVMGIRCYTLGEASARYGEKNRKAFWRLLDKLDCPRIQPGGVGSCIYFPEVQFDKWMAEERNKVGCTR